MAITDEQGRAILLTERIASVFSVIGCSYIVSTFLLSARFRKPVNRLIFFAALGNILANIATLLSTSGITAGSESALCQFQGFMIQMFVPADALWNLCMAINVYLTVFKNYNAAQLRRLEPMYLVCNYGLTFIVAFCYCFISTADKGKIYGEATLWCWITAPYEYLRIATCYAPAWLSILFSFCIYILAGRDIWQKRQQLRAFSNTHANNVDLAVIENPFDGFQKTTEIQVTTEIFQVGGSNDNASQISVKLDPQDQNMSHNGYEQYTAHIGRGPRGSLVPAVSYNTRQTNAAMEANTAVLGYFKCCVLFFASLLITWVPSSLNRVWSIAHPGETSFPLAYAAGLVLPLMGFWNSVIYITTSWKACKELWTYDIAPVIFFWRARPTDRWSVSNRHRARSADHMGSPRTLSSAEQGGHVSGDNASISESMKKLAGGYRNDPTN